MCLVWKGGAALPSYTLPCLLQRPASTPMTPYPESCAGLEIDDAVVQQWRLDGLWESVNVFLGSKVVRPLGNRHLRVGWAGTVDKRRRSEQTRVAKTETHTRARAVRNRKHMHTNCLPSVAQTHSVLGKLSGPFARDVDGHLCELLVNVDVGVLHKAACTLLLAKQTLAVVRAVGVHADRAWVALVVACQTLVNVWQVKKK